MGQELHLPNPALATADTHFQPAALNYAHHLRPMREADFFISMDVDEFINIRVGDGTLPALFAAAGAFDVLSITEINHGANRRETYERGWVLDQFPLYQTLAPGPRRARRGVKSIVRLSEKVERRRNHRPDMSDTTGTVVWLDGSGRDQTSLPADRGENGLDCRGPYGLVRLEHFALRALDSYLAKMNRGDVVIKGKQVSRSYWRTRNRNEEANADYGDRLMCAKDYFARHFQSDTRLMDLHDTACAAHADRIARLVADPVFLDRRNRALSEAW